MAVAARSHVRFPVRIRGKTVKNAKVQFNEIGGVAITDLFDARTAGNNLNGVVVTNTYGEVDAFIGAPRTLEVVITDNNHQAVWSDDTSVHLRFTDRTIDRYELQADPEVEFSSPHELHVSVDGSNDYAYAGHPVFPFADPVAAVAAAPYLSGGAGVSVALTHRPSSAAQQPHEAFNIAALAGGTWALTGNGIHIRVRGGGGTDQTGPGYSSPSNLQRRITVLYYGAPVGTSPLLDIQGIRQLIEYIGITNTGSGSGLRQGQLDPAESHGTILRGLIVTRCGAHGIVFGGAHNDNLTIEYCTIGYNAGDGIRGQLTNGTYSNGPNVRHNNLVWNGTWVLGGDNCWTNTVGLGIRLIGGGQAYSGVNARTFKNYYFGSGLGWFGARNPNACSEYFEPATFGPDNVHRVKDDPFFVTDVSPDGDGSDAWKVDQGTQCHCFFHQSAAVGAWTLPGGSPSGAWTTLIGTYMHLKNWLNGRIEDPTFVLGGPNHDGVVGSGTEVGADAHMTANNPLMYVEASVTGLYARLGIVKNRFMGVRGPSAATVAAFALANVIGPAAVRAGANAQGVWGEYIEQDNKVPTKFGAAP